MTQQGRGVGVIRAGTALAAAALAGCATVERDPSADRPPAFVDAHAETEPVRGSGDAADDPAVWVHPTDPGRSLVFGSDKKRGVATYDLAGRELAFDEVGPINNIDLRRGVRVGGEASDLLAGSRRSDDHIQLFRIDPAAPGLRPAGAFPTDLDGVYGVAMHRDPATGAAEVLVNTKPGEVRRYRITRLGTGVAADARARLVDGWSVGGPTEGMVVDDATGSLFLGEETGGVWLYRLRGEETARRLVARVRPDAPWLTADVEGLALVPAPGGEHRLIASSQGSDRFVVYRAELDRPEPVVRPIGWFRVRLGDDEVSGTDGIGATTRPVPGYPGGLLVVQDDENPGANQNFKLVPLGPALDAAGAGDG